MNKKTIEQVENFKYLGGVTGRWTTKYRNKREN